MNLKERARKGGRENHPAGFTLIEVIVVIAVSGFAIALLYGVFGSLYKSWVTEGLKSDMRQNVRVGLDTVTRDLEMTGYHTTNYGDLNKANLAVTLAAVGEVEVDQHWLNIDTGISEPRMIYYHLATNVTTGKQNLYRQVRLRPGLPAMEEIVAENIESFVLSYFDEDGTEITALPAVYTAGSAPPQALKDIRRICVSVTAGTEREPPSGTAAPNLELSTCVTPRNLTVDSTIADSTPPCTPSNLKVADTRDCHDKLCVRWDKCSDPDLDGYIVYYGPGNVMKLPLTAIGDPNNPNIYLNSADVLITKEADRLSSPNTYSVTVAAFDSSGNTSSPSLPVAGNPLPDVSDCTGGTGDTTVNPAKPDRPQNFTVTPGNEEELILAWSPPADDAGTAYDESFIVGYRLYRSLTPFADGLQPIPNSLLLSDEATLDQDAQTFSDAGLKGCVNYYYAAASINCDETLADGYTFDTSGLGDYASAGSAPLDTTPCPAPKLDGTSEGYQRIFVALYNPNKDECRDFDRTEIYYHKDNKCPSMDNGSVKDGTLVPDSDQSPLIPGTFKQRGSQTFIFDSKSEAEPTTVFLDETKQHCLMAVSYDGCGNYAASSTVQLTPDAPCDDVPAGRPPGWPVNPTYTTCDPEWVNLGWEYPEKDTITDFAGYRLWREGPSPGVPVELTVAAIKLESWTDAYNLVEGGSYRYVVRATDRVFEVCNDSYPTNYSDPLTIPGDDPDWISDWIRPGRIEYHEPAPYYVTTFPDGFDVNDKATYTYHNNVRFFVRNTSAGIMTVEEMTVAWINPNAVLAQIEVGASASSSCAALNPQTSLRTDISPADTVIPVDSTADFPALGVISIGGEQISYTSIDGAADNFLGALRGANGTAPSSHIAGNTVVPNPKIARCLLDADITDVAAGPSSPGTPVPVVLRFANEDGSVNRFTDMRGETLQVSAEVRNRSLQGSDCDPESFEVPVPEGPRLGNFFQDPSCIFPTPSLAVPGETGTVRDDDLEVPPATPINVFGTAFDNSGLGFTSLSLLYDDAAVAASGDVPVMPAGAPTELFFQNLGGNSYALYDEVGNSGSPIPSIDDRVVWYYLVAVDQTGNFDRIPEPATGNYAYYQGLFDVCAATPQAPLLHGTTSPGSVSLTWDATERYIDCGDIHPSDTLTYDLWYWAVPGGTPEPLPGCSPAISPPGCTDSSLDLEGGAFAFAVKATNTCSPDGRESFFSNVFYECEGDQDFCPLFTVEPARTMVGESITLRASNICFFAGNNSNDSVDFRVTSGLLGTQDVFTATEIGDSGTFEAVIAATSNPSLPPATSLSAAVTPSDTVIPVDSTADYPPRGLIAVGPEIVHYTGLTGTSFTGASRGMDGTTAEAHSSGAAVSFAISDVVTVGADDTLTCEFLTGSDVRSARHVSLDDAGCLDDPATPGSFQAVHDGSTGVLVSWLRPASTDLAGYQVEYRRCTDQTSPCPGWNSWAQDEVTDLCAESLAVTVEAGYEYQFRMRSGDSCPSSPRFSADTAIITVP